MINNKICYYCVIIGAVVGSGEGSGEFGFVGNWIWMGWGSFLWCVGETDYRDFGILNGFGV